jgi:hypothetical protein
MHQSRMGYGPNNLGLFQEFTGFPARPSQPSARPASLLGGSNPALSLLSAYLAGLDWLAGAGVELASQPAPSSSQSQPASIQPIQIQIVGTAIAHANN